jgi:preprotein translocase subunit Sec61beta
MNYLQAGLKIDPLAFLNVALAIYMAYMAALEALARGASNPLGLLAVKLCPKIILYMVSCIAVGVFDFFQRR